MEKLFLYILCFIIALFTIFIIIIYLKSDSLKSYPSYFTIYFCLIITFDNGIRLIKLNQDEEEKNPSPICKAQAFILSFFDKLFIISITSYAIINYIIMVAPDIYETRIKIIYIILVIISLFFSAVLTVIFFMRGINNDPKSDFCYVVTDDAIKIIVDSIYTCILLFIDLFCIIRVLVLISKLIKTSQQSYKKQNLKLHLCRFIVDLILNIITFGYLLLLINKKLSFEPSIIKDYLFIILCLINELFFAMNGEMYKEIMRIITCNKVEKYKKSNKGVNNLITQNEDKDNEEEEDY